MGLLEEIIRRKREHVAQRRAALPTSALRDLCARRRVSRSFETAIRRSGPIRAIAEMKRRSPSGGALRADLDPREIASAYAAHGAAALSVLTDEPFFAGRDADVAAAQRGCALPVLRKDFVIDEYQLAESRAIGADAVLLIVRLLDDAQLRDWIAASRELGLAALVESHDERELGRAIAAGATILGVNNRDLDTLRTTLDTSVALRPIIPAGCIAVAESGMRTRDDVRRVADVGYDAILVGETLLRSGDPGAALSALLGEECR